jgi:glycosyltransferase involved in cell wall biosynthesis
MLFGSKRILFDLSTSMHWRGPPTGIVRVEREFALWAAAHMPGTEFVFFDPATLTYRRIIGDVHRLLSGEAVVDMFGLTDPAMPKKRRTDRVPAVLRPTFLWITQTRRMMLHKLELTRLKTTRPHFAAMLDRTQQKLMSKKYRAFMVREDGTRRPFYPYEMVIGDPVSFKGDDILICVGNGWGHTDIKAIGDLKTRVGFQMALLCHDLIPIMFPEFYRKRDVRLFSNYMRQALAIADQIVVNSRAVKTDCQNFCLTQDIEPKKIMVGFLGSDIRSDSSRVIEELPRPLMPRQFALFVSTIEPRKGHALLCNVWHRLIAEGIPQSKGFKLVFVGRTGWMVDDLIESIRSDQELSKHIVMLHNVTDEKLAALYRQAAFCVYPSRYEGYGLPVVEAFQYGKAVLASSGGALPELTSDFSPTIDAMDEDAWYVALKSWLLDPAEYQNYEEKIRTGFRHPPWSAAAKQFFERITEDR